MLGLWARLSYPRSLCPDCFSEDVKWLIASCEGTIYSYSTAQGVRGWPEEHLPLVVAYVEIDEGPKMISNIEADPEAVDVWTHVEVTFIDTELPGVAVPVFALAE